MKTIQFIGNLAAEATLPYSQGNSTQTDEDECAPVAQVCMNSVLFRSSDNKEYANGRAWWIMLRCLRVLDGYSGTRLPCSCSASTECDLGFEVNKESSHS
jgi:hypothetical protein